MPNSRHQRNHRHREDDAHNNNHQPAPVACPREVVAGAVHAMANHSHQNDNAGARLQKCCAPGVCRAPDDLIDPDEPFDAVKVLCNNEQCTEGSWMHKDCFEDFEQSVLAYLRSCGRARSWSEKQRLQNLWTKKGYDLAFKACDCKCGRGHLRKDLDYIPAPFNENSKKHKKHKKKNDKPMPVVSTTHKANSHSHHVGHLNGPGTCTTTTTTHTTTPNVTRGNQNHDVTSGGRSEKKGKKTTTTTKGQKSDSNGNLHLHQGSLDNHHTSRSTPTAITNNPHTLGNHNNNSSVLPGVLPGSGGSHNPQLRLRTNSVSSTGSAGSHSSSSSLPSSAGSASPISSSPVSGEMFFKNRKSSDASSEGSTTSISGFRHRMDLSAFAALPRNKQNPYHIRMEDVNTLACSFTSCSIAAAKAHTLAEVAAEAGSCDLETRNFVLSNLLSKKMSSARCALCKTVLAVFDRFPLLDGSFFLSPQSYDELAIQVIWEGRLQFLNAACLSCLEGHNSIRCVACKRPWDGCNLVVGSMYTYDIFAATPCCQKRLTCKCCRRAVVDIAKGLEFYSQYSQMIICPYCQANDYHFIRSLSETFTVSEEGAIQREPICQ
ncbi:headcase protein homolog [Babylonia areolata]|uniref:headcase protein homolog n=1 Tax=Babylonia areolata TaxID=304850 RepID=UPI003FD65C99